MRKPAFPICENGADQLQGNCAADRAFVLRLIDRIIPLLPKTEILRLYSSSVAVQPVSCLTWSETPKTGFSPTLTYRRAAFISHDHVTAFSYELIKIALVSKLRCIR